jgi:NAD(P)-dependent dehydrogenase (short-subunit alcohol dehydrogenase family)
MIKSIDYFSGIDYLFPMGNSDSGRPDGRGVLVTGSSSGIGRAVAVRLARGGFTVFAGVRNEAGLKELESLDLDGLIPVHPLDVRNPDHVEGAVRSIESRLGREGLFAIVNNAGGGGVAPIELMDLEEMRAELETRILGPMALLQAFLPSLRRAKGRVIWIATPALIPVPYVSSIHACDYAVNCLARTLSIELSPWKIPCIFIRCGGIRTPSVEKSARALRESMSRWPKERLALYRDALERQGRELAAFDRKRSGPETVAEKVFDALSAQRPKRVYRAGYLSRSAAMLGILPQSMVDAIMSARAG